MTPELSVLTYPHSTLKTPAVPVTVFDSHLAEIVKQMLQIMYQEDGIVGLAGPQVGLSWRLFVLDVSVKQDEPLCFINPVIVEQAGQCQSEEGCLSLPGIFVKVPRAKTITVEYQTEQGKRKHLSAEGLLANAIQHELDHLNGVLLIDKLSKLKRMMALKKIEKMQRMES